MKVLKYISVALLSLVAFASCDSDLDKVTYSEGDAKLGTFDQIKSSYKLDIDNAKDTVQVFQWAEATFGYPAQITYQVEIAKKGVDFADKIVLTSVIGSTKSSITAEELNNAISQLDTLYQDKSNENSTYKASFEIRLTASIGQSAPSLYSESQSAEITGYYVPVNETKPVVYITGDGILNIPTWKNATADIGGGLQLFFSDTPGSESLVYTYTGQFLSGKGMKFPIQAGNWDSAYAADGSILRPDNDKENGGNGANYIIPVATDGLYTLEIDTKALTIKMTPYTGTVSTYATIGIVGDGANGWPSDTDVTDIAMSNPTPHVWVAKDVELKAGGEIKFRADKAWSADWGASADQMPMGLGKKGGDNFKIAADGKYFLALNDITGHYIIIPMDQLP